jgi:membrane-bound lytic murein transglycosylase D
MDPITLPPPDDASGKRLPMSGRHFARTALASFVAVQLACGLTGCMTMEQRANADGSRFVSVGADALVEPGETLGASAGSATTESTAPSFFARLFGSATPPPAAPRERPAGDVWESLRRGFRLDDRHDGRIARAAAQYSSSQESWNAIEERARQFLPLVVKETKKRGMPLELALLPVVESTYNPTAVGGGAVGMWQIMPGTAKVLGLRRDGTYDGRRDVVAATAAALDYLQTLANEFNGDWELALAAYNAGSGTVKRAIESNRAKGKSTDYWSLNLPAHTEAYVPKLLGIARVIREPGSYGMQLGDIPAEPTVTPVAIAEEIDLSLAARLAGMSVSEFRSLNPGFLSANASSREDHVLLVPKHKAASLVAQLKDRSTLDSADARVRETLDIVPESRVAAVAPAQSTAKKTSANGSRTHVVGNGDTLWSVAREAGIAPVALAKANGIKPDAVLRTGQRLTLPGGPARTSQNATPRSRNKSKS